MINYVFICNKYQRKISLVVVESNIGLHREYSSYKTILCNYRWKKLTVPNKTSSTGFETAIDVGNVNIKFR